MKKLLITLLFLASLVASAQTYTNPVVLHGADPGVIKHNGVYYLYCTNTQDYDSGFKVFTSTDLVNWTDRGWSAKAADIWGKKDFWAPEVFTKNGKFYMLYSSELRMCIAVSDSPLGPFVTHGPGKLADYWSIDAHYFMDDDGKEYIYYNYEGISVATINPELTAISNSQLCFNDVTLDEAWVTEVVNEAPWMLKHKGIYYLVYSANGTGPNYGVAYATSTSPTGPWTKYGGNPILFKTPDNNIIGTGHCAFVNSPDDSGMEIVYHVNWINGNTDDRKICVDKAWFEAKNGGLDVLKVAGPSSTPQPYPSNKVADEQCTFTNPAGGDAPDPWVLKKDGMYYFCHTTGWNVTIYKSDKLENIYQGEQKMVWVAPGGSPFGFSIWAPEIHYIKGKWYIYVCGNRNDSFEGHEMFVLEGTSQDPFGDFVYKGRLETGIDGNVIEMEDGSLYYTWSYYNPDQRIYISKMSNPWTLTGNYTELSRPTYDWETRGAGINEGPQFLKNGNTLMVFYSASGSWTRDYCLGMVYCTNGDLMNPNSWTKLNYPVFQSSDANGIYGPGHCSFTTSPNGGENWIAYHAKNTNGGGWENRTLHLQPFTFNTNGLAEFGVPYAQNTPIKCPSSATQQPYFQSPQTIPGVVEAENYDKGGEGLAYHDTESLNKNGAYRLEGVDVEECTEGGYNIAWSETGEWTEYTVNVTQTGNYTLKTRVASMVDGGKFHIDVDGISETPIVNTPNTGGWQTWQTVTTQINLKAGQHVLRFTYDRNGFNVDKFIFENTTTATSGTGNGLAGHYFNGQNFETEVFARTDATIDFNWLEGSPNPSVTNDNFSVRWKGQIEPRYTDFYTFFLNSDNGRRLWINGELIIDKWLADWGTEYSGQINLVAGQKYDIELDYFEAVGGANCKLSWSSYLQNREVIPQSQLYSQEIITALSDDQFSTTHVYPNPFTSGFQLTSTKKLSQVKVFSIYGTELLNIEQPDTTNLFGSNLAKGTYLIQLQTEDGSTNVIKVVKGE